MFKTRTAKTIIFIGLFLFSILLLFLPKDFFDKGQSLCVSRLLFDIECYGCGMTRAIQHLIHFDFQGAWDFNKLSFLVLPLIIYLILKEIYDEYLLKK